MSRLKIFVIGSGGREHALVWKIHQSPLVEKIYVAPGNPGMASLAQLVPLRADDVPGLVNFAKTNQVDLTIVGPELPLTLGIANAFEREGLALFGPNREAAVLEGSKVWTKKFLEEERIPTAVHESFDDYDRAVAFLGTQAYPIVIKADGLASGKGVIIAKDRAEAVAALESILLKKNFGDAGKQVVIEEFLEGTEVSFHVLVDGSTFLPLATAQDHKRVGDGDQGPNTGGMGTFSPSPYVDETLQARIENEIIKPTLQGLLKRGIQYRGVLFAGLMLTAAGPKLLEYNVRFGDPETQSLLMRMEGDIVPILQAVIAGHLTGKTLRWKEDRAVCVVMAAYGYPGEVNKGDVITGLDIAATVPQTMIFHSGTKQKESHWLTDGGRVLGVSALGQDLRQARERAYDVCEKIHWRGVHYRRDIGLKRS